MSNEGGDGSDPSNSNGGQTTLQVALQNLTIMVIIQIMGFLPLIIVIAKKIIFQIPILSLPMILIVVMMTTERGRFFALNFMRLIFREIKYMSWLKGSIRGKLCLRRIKIDLKQ